MGLPTEPIVNENGDVAITHFNTVPHQMKVGGYTYYFGVKANICMAWVKQAHVQQLLDTFKVCCGGHKRKRYRLSSPSEVEHWMK